MTFLERLAKNYFVIIPVIVLAVYVQILNFHTTGLDDDLTIGKNFERISNIGNITSEFTRNYLQTAEYKPLTMISYYFNAAISGKYLYSYHLTDILLHIIVCLLLFQFLKRLKFSDTESFIGSLIFAVHPLLSSTISWIPGRSFILMALFGLLALIFWIEYFKSNRTLTVWISGLFLILSWLSDPLGISVIAIMYIYALIYEQPNFKDNFGIFSAPVFAVIIIYVSLLVSIVPDSTHIANNPGNIFAVKILGYNINFRNFLLLPEFSGFFILPYKLYVLPITNIIMIIVGTIILAGIFLFLKIKKSSFKDASFGLLILLSTAVILIFYGSSVNYKLMDYHYGFAYLSLAGLIILMLSVIRQLNINYQKKSFSVGFLLVVALLAFLSFYNAKNFKSEFTFFEKAYSDNQENQNISNNLLSLYLIAGEPQKAESIIKLNEKTGKPSSNLYYTLSTYYFKSQNYASAIANLKKIDNSDSTDRVVRNLLISSYFGLKEYDNAAEILKPLINDTLNYPEARWDLFTVYLESQNFDKATDYALENFKTQDDKDKALVITDTWSKYYFKQQDNVALVKTLKTGLEIEPENPVILNYLFDIYTQIGMKEKAREYENRLKKIFNEKVLEKQK